MISIRLAGNAPWNKLLKDDVTSKEEAEKAHILKEGRDAEEEFKRKHF
mgnify:CR=1 FL=1|tara:strand:- start:2883 stop:3026 length:144 start_codon:yes stop_codon:yes gene_type:complete